MSTLYKGGPFTAFAGVCLLLAVLAVFFGGGHLLSLWETGEGYRDGVPVRVSEAGVLWKVGEVELMSPVYVGQSSWSPLVFQVADQEVLAKVRAAPAGQPVRIRYRQYAGSGGGPSNLWVTGVEPIGE